jgi:hypothetical protein
LRRPPKLRRMIGIVPKPKSPAIGRHETSAFGRQIGRSVQCRATNINGSLATMTSPCCAYDVVAMPSCIVMVVMEGHSRFPAPERAIASVRDVDSVIAGGVTAANLPNLRQYSISRCPDDCLGTRRKYSSAVG